MKNKTKYAESIKEKPIVITGFGSMDFGKQYRQGNRVYSSNHIAMALMSKPVGNMGGMSYLYLVRHEKS